MSCSTTTFYKSLLLLSLIGAVFSVHEKAKRDVHRIIIQERVPRSHKKSHAGLNHGHKKGKRPHYHGSQDSDSSSYEDSDSFSRENSYEEAFRSQKTHKSSTKKKPAHRNPDQATHLKFGESQQHSRRQEPKTNFQNDWVPLNSDQVMQHSQENYRKRDKNNKRKDAKGAKAKQKKHNAKPHVLELSTSYPLLHFQGSTIYPTISLLPADFSSYNKNILEMNQSPLISTMEHPEFNFSIMNGEDDRLKNHRPSYDIAEAQSSTLHSYILLPDNKPDGSSGERHELIVGQNKKTHGRNRNNRGRGNRFNKKD